MGFLLAGIIGWLGTSLALGKLRRNNIAAAIKTASSASGVAQNPASPSQNPAVGTGVVAGAPGNVNPVSIASLEEFLSSQFAPGGSGGGAGSGSTGGGTGGGSTFIKSGNPTLSL